MLLFLAPWERKISLLLRVDLSDLSWQTPGSVMPLSGRLSGSSLLGIFSMGQYLPAMTKSLLSFFPDELNKLSCLCLVLSCFFSESFFIPFLWTSLTISTLLLNCKHQNWTWFLTVALPLLCMWATSNPFICLILLFSTSQDCIALLAAELQWDFILRCLFKKNPKSFSMSLFSKKSPCPAQPLVFLLYYTALH